MGEHVVYYVPMHQDLVAGCGLEIANALAAHGLSFRIYLAEMLTGEPEAPPSHDGPCLSTHGFTRSDMAIADLPDPIPVPELIAELLCPNCERNISDAAYDVWESESELAIPDRQVHCPECGAIVESRYLRSPNEPFTFACFFLWISDIDPNDWEPEVKATIESVVGPCLVLETYMT